MGALPHVCYSELGLHPAPSPFRSSGAVRSWQQQGLPVFVHGNQSDHILAKRTAFFALRGAFAVISSYCEAKLYRSVAENVHLRVGRYMLFMLVFSAGMWTASTGTRTQKSYLQPSLIQYQLFSLRRSPCTPQLWLAHTHFDFRHSLTREGLYSRR
jgi:hypothetical protein